MFATLLILSTLLAVPSIFVLIEATFAVFYRPRSDGVGCTGSALVLIPAHNEAEIIAATVRHIRQQLNPTDRLIVIADNCSDNTAVCAEAAGAYVVIRHDERLKGKGHALEFGHRAAGWRPNESLVVIDADCRISLNGIRALASHAETHGRPIQARNIVIPSAQSGPHQRLSAFAFAFRNVVRAGGGAALGLPCPLMGTGMSFPSNLRKSLRLESGSIVEDRELGVSLALDGFPAMWCPSVTVTRPKPPNELASFQQRRRWEHGQHGSGMTMAWHYLKASAQRRSISMLAAAIDTLVPPLALYFVLTAIHISICSAYGAIRGEWIPLWASLFPFTALAASVVIGWFIAGRELVTLEDLLKTPLYILRKLPLYIQFATSRQANWNRTTRELTRTEQGDE